MIFINYENLNHETLKVNKLFIRYILIIIAVFTLDYISKDLIFTYLEDLALKQQDFNPKIEVLPFFNIVYVWNRGVSFGMFNWINNSHLILSILQGSITLILLVILIRSKDVFNNYAFSIIIGGALGNVFDRIINGAVADFLDFYIGEYHWPAFNFADCAIFIGVFLLLFRDFFIKKDVVVNKNLFNKYENKENK